MYIHVYIIYIYYNESNELSPCLIDLINIGLAIVVHVLTIFMCACCQGDQQADIESVRVSRAVCSCDGRVLQ